MTAATGRRFIWLSMSVAAGLGCLLFLQPVRIFHWQEFRTGDAIVRRVEAYRSIHGRYPDTLEEIGANDSKNQVFYRKTGDSDYLIWFGTSLGESETYDSHTHRWD